MRVGNKRISASTVTVLEELRAYFRKNGLERFRSIQNKGDYIMTNCPIHKNGQEHNPSCGILTVDKDGKPAGLLHCFSCGYVATFDKMISQVIGKNDDGEFGREWLLTNFINTEDEDREIDLGLDDSYNTQEVQIVPESELKRYRYYHPYWGKRKIPESICIKFDLGFDKQLNAITMPFWDLRGRCVGVTRRLIYTKKYLIPKGITKPVYLLNFAIKEHWAELCLCESQINALYLNSLGYKACACFGTGTESQAEDIIRSGVRSVVICFDGDDAGRNGAKKMYNYLRNSVLCSKIVVPEGKDVNDLSAEEIKCLMENQENF